MRKVWVWIRRKDCAGSALRRNDWIAAAHGASHGGFARQGMVWFALCALSITQLAWAYPEFQQYVQKTSGRKVNCAMCHVHPDGPEGLKPGQIGSLTQPELDELGRARAAFEPGQNVDNPILNPFGDSIIKKLGKTKFLQIRLHPEELPAAIGSDSDLDHDGVPDSAEFMAGTDPLDEGSGPPTQLFVHNLLKNAFNLIMMIIATVLGIYGLNALLHGLDQTMRSRREAQPQEKL